MKIAKSARYLPFFYMVVLMLSISCTQSEEQQQLEKYLASIAAAEASAPAAGGSLLGGAGTGGSTQIIGGTPRVVKDGTCGDGIINGTMEDCDKGAITNPYCSELGGISGQIRCSENCLYDISDCITPATNERIGGTAETCKCNCSGNRCSGGCSPLGTNSVGTATCRYDCDNDCICKCEGKTEAHVENCEFRCTCTVDGAGNPICECAMDTCEVLTVISPNIANLTAGGGGGGKGGH